MPGYASAMVKEINMKINTFYKGFSTPPEIGKRLIKTLPSDTVFRDLQTRQLISRSDAAASNQEMHFTFFKISPDLKGISITHSYVRELNQTIHNLTTPYTMSFIGIKDLT